MSLPTQFTTNLTVRDICGKRNTRTGMKNVRWGDEDSDREWIRSLKPLRLWMLLCF